MDAKAFMGAPGEPRLPGGKPAVSRRGSFWSWLFPGRSKPKVPLEEETPYAEQSVVGRAKQQMQVKRSRSLLTQLAENSGMGRSSALAVTQLEATSVPGVAKSGLLRNVPTLSSHEVDIIQQSWDQVMATHGVGAVSLFYKNLFEIGPHLEALFQRTKGLQEVMFKDMMMMLVKKLHDWEWIVHTLEASALRHLRYGVTLSMFPTVGKALLQTLEMGLGTSWTPDVEAAWVKLWVAVEGVMSMHLKADGLTRAVACNNLDMIKAELNDAPRSERISRMLTVLPSGSTPLLIAIRDRKVEMVQYMLSDILAIRCDRDRYYYGRDQLWAVHPSIVEEIVAHVPVALTDLLDGCMWKSSHTDMGVRRANFYIKGFYGEPETPITATPLAHMMDAPDNTAFVHPVTGMVVFQKWNLFGRGYFYRHVLGGLAGLFFLIMGYIAFGRTIQGLPFRILFWLYILVDFIVQIRRATALGFLKAKVLGVTVQIPVHFITVTQVVKMMMNLLVLASIPFEDTWNSGGELYESILMATATIAYCFSLLHYYLASRELSSFVFTISRMLYDFIKFLAVYILIWLGFALAFYILLGTIPHQEGSTANFSSVNYSFTTFYIMLFGYAEFDFQDLSNPRRGVAIALWFIYLLLANLLLLNLLIAQFSSTYETVYKDSYAVTVKKLAQELLAIEGTLNVHERRKYYEKLKLDEPLEFDEYDVGPSGGIQVLEDVDLSSDAVRDRILRYSGKADPNLPWPEKSGRVVRGAKEAELIELAGNGEAQRCSEKSPVEVWDNHSPAKRFSIADNSEPSTLTGMETWYRAGFLRAIGISTVQEVTGQTKGEATPAITLKELARHTTNDSLWLAIGGKVYDVTNFVHRHPGGEVILSAVGRDATADFNGFGHSDHARSMLGSLEVGQVVMMQTSQNSRKKSTPQKR